MRCLIVNEEPQLRDVISFLLEGRFSIGSHEVGTVKEAVQVLADKEQAFDIVVCDYKTTAKTLIQYALQEKIDLHFLCTATEKPDDILLLSRKEWVHYIPDSTLIESLEVTIRRLFKEFQI